MIQPKTKEDIDFLREGGQVLGRILKELEKAVHEGVASSGDKSLVGITSLDLENLARKFTAEAGATPAFLGYTPHGAERAYPAALCLSINNVVVHGIPNEKVVKIKEGDLVTLDMGISYKQRIVDSAVTISAGGEGKTNEKGRKLLQAGRECLDAALEACKNWPKDFPGGIKTGDIGQATEKALDHYHKTYGFNFAEGLGGHGVGYAVHEDPFVPNFGKGGQGPILKPGIVIAIEPIINEGTGDIDLMNDGYTIVTHDGKRSVHFEHTVVITEDGAEVLTEVH